MPFSVESDAPNLRFGSANSGSSSSTLKELYSVPTLSHAHSIPQNNEPQSQADTLPNLGMTYPVRKYDRHPYPSFQSHYTAQSSYSTLEGWAGGEASRGSSSRSHGEPLAFTLTPFGQHSNEWGTISTVSEGNSTSLTNNIPFDPTLRWYDITEENYRSTTETRRTAQYSNDSESFRVNEDRRPNANRSGEYEFLFPDSLI
jgi:hypothetical protein